MEPATLDIIKKAVQEAFSAEGGDKRLYNVPPFSTLMYMAYDTFTHPIVVRYLLMRGRFIGAQFTNLSYLIFRQLRTPRLLSAYREMSSSIIAVLDISRGRTPLQVCHQIIRRIAVKMIYVWQIIRIGYESFRHKTVDIKPSFNTIFHQYHKLISIISLIFAHPLTFVGFYVGNHDRAFNYSLSRIRPDLSVLGNRIQSFVSKYTLHWVPL